ncbi:transposase [Elysia marginata]|uniref:Transposase n=1 Tax=Elysia marginata TaxID=1093978 RepID=A0AAV4GHQ0_9GAST|nr:transposase [Elysia marginata]
MPKSKEYVSDSSGSDSGSEDEKPKAKKPKTEPKAEKKEKEKGAKNSGPTKGDNGEFMFEEFNEGKESLFDCPGRGRQKSCVNEQTIASIKKDIDEDPHISVRELMDTNGISYDTVHTIITEHLRIKKVMKLGSPSLSFHQNASIVLRPGFESRKRTFKVFFHYRGPLEVDILPQDTTMTATHYVQNVISQVKSAIMSSDQRLAPPGPCFFMTMQVPIKQGPQLKSLWEIGIQVLPHPAYSPALAPCDFWLFPILKDRLAGRKWQIRLKLCIESYGEYFEGL